jgi:hypothetical protein
LSNSYISLDGTVTERDHQKMAETDSSSSSNAVAEEPSSSPTSASASLASMAENFQRSAIESARTVQHTSSTQFRTFQVSSLFQILPIPLRHRQHI